MKALNSLISLSHLSPPIPTTMPDISPEDKIALLENITNRQKLIDDQEKPIVIILKYCKCRQLRLLFLIKAQSIVKSAEKVSSLLTKKVLSTRVPDEDPVVMGDENWELKVQKLRRVSLYNIDFSYSKSRRKISFPSLSSELLKGYKENEINLEVCFKIFSMSAL